MPVSYRVELRAQANFWALIFEPAPEARTGQGTALSVQLSHVAKNRDWAAVTASLNILAHVAQWCCTLRGCRSRVRVHYGTRRVHVVYACGVHRSGTLCRFAFEGRRSFCAMETFLHILTHNLAKVPPSAVPSTVSVAIIVCARRSLSADQPELHAKRWDSHTCLDFAQSTDKVALWAFSREKYCSKADSWSCGRTFGCQTCWSSAIQHCTLHE